MIREASIMTVVLDWTRLSGRERPSDVVGLQQTGGHVRTTDFLANTEKMGKKIFEEPFSL